MHQQVILLLLVLQPTIVFIFFLFEIYSFVDRQDCLSVYASITTAYPACVLIVLQLCIILVRVIVPIGLTAAIADLPVVLIILK